MYLNRLSSIHKLYNLYTALSTFQFIYTTYTPFYQQDVDNFIPYLFKTNIWNISDFILI